jgi:glutathione gamma-glutamylcysteinyltransferase
MLDCCKDLKIVKEKGITFEEFECIARCNGAEVVSVHGSER